MRVRNISSVLGAAFIITAALASTPAIAGCKKLGFTVNHYGKEGPTRDSKALLDKYVVTWTQEHGIKKYSKSKKTVSCYKFLDFGFFDEWTCKAVTKICFRGPVPGGASKKTLNVKAKTKKYKKKKSANAKKTSTAKKKVAKAQIKSKPKKAPSKSEMANAEADLAKARANLAKLEAALAKAEATN